MGLKWKPYPQYRRTFRALRVREQDAVLGVLEHDNGRTLPRRRSLTCCLDMYAWILLSFRAPTDPEAIERLSDGRGDLRAEVHALEEEIVGFLGPEAFVACRSAAKLKSFAPPEDKAYAGRLSKIVGALREQ